MQNLRDTLLGNTKSVREVNVCFPFGVPLPDFLVPRRFARCVVREGGHRQTLTGHLGDVMKESAQAAMSYARSKAGELNINADFYEKLDLHIHVPAGAIPKDGPSAGVTMATAVISSLTKRR